MKERLYTFGFISIIILGIITAAHFYRQSEMGLVFISLISPLLLIFSRKWCWYILQYLIFLNSLEWLKTTINILILRISIKQPYFRASLIMGSVFLFNILCILLIKTESFKKRYKEYNYNPYPSLFAFIFITLLAAIPYKKLDILQPLILERLLPRSGWIEIFFLGIYGAIITEKLLYSTNTSTLRQKIWLLFSIVFFGQLFLGLSGFSVFLMNNSLHLPIPGILIAGPVFRGKISLFMPLLLIFSILIVGPAWCSWLCYSGSFDLIASKKSNLHSEMRLKTTVIFRIVVILVLTGTAMLLRLTKVNSIIASLFGIGYGLIGISIMINLSTKRGIMVHCTSYCPIGLITTTIGKINLFRIKINKSCIKCNRCIKICKYGALSTASLTKGIPDLRCTLCGDCISSCKGSYINYSFLSLSPQMAKQIFITLIVILHTLFLGFGRI